MNNDNNDEKGGGGHCVLLISDEWYTYENFGLSSKLLKEAFLIFWQI